MKSEIYRKLFHLLGLLYVLALNALPRPLFIKILLGLVILDFIVETCRLKFPSFKLMVNKFFGAFIRLDENLKFTGAFWMMLGVLGTALLIESTPLATTQILYLIFGDTAAALGGKFFKGPHWFHSAKRVSGSVACFSTCVLIGFLMLGQNYAWPGLLLIALAATIFEYGFLPINDNVLLPVGTSLVSLLVYQSPPYLLSLFHPN